MQSFGKALRVMVRDMTGGVGLPELAGQIIELLRMRGVDSAGERVDEHSMALSSGRASSGKANPIPKTMFPD
jgi:hypothetical protein